MSRKTFFTAALTLTLVVTAGCTDSTATKQHSKVPADTQAQAAPTLEPVTAPLSDYGKYVPLKRQSETDYAWNPSDIQFGPVLYRTNRRHCAGLSVSAIDLLYAH